MYSHCLLHGCSGQTSVCSRCYSLCSNCYEVQDKKGKGRHTDWAAEVEQEQRALEVLIGMTAKTLCRRSNAHLEQALLLVEVTLGHSNLHWKMLVEQHLSRQAAALAAAAAEAQKAVKEVEEAQKAVKEAEEAKKKAEGQQDTQMQASTDAEAQQAPELAAPAAAGSGQQGPASGSAQQEAPSTIAQQASTTQARQAAPSSTAAAENASTASTSAGAATDSAGAATANTANPGTGAGPATGSPGASGQGKGVEVPELNQADNPEPVIQSLPEQLLKHLPRLLGQSGLSDLAQKRCATIIKNMVDMCPKLKPLMLSELQDELQRSVHICVLPCCFFTQCSLSLQNH